MGIEKMNDPDYANLCAEVARAGMTFDRAEPMRVFRYDLEDGREVTIYRMLYNARVCIGPPGEGVYELGFCYASAGDALLGAVEWIVDGACGDGPRGWIKNLQTGEYIEPVRRA